MGGEQYCGCFVVQLFCCLVEGLLYLWGLYLLLVFEVDLLFDDVVVCVVDGCGQCCVYYDVL